MPITSIRVMISSISTIIRSKAPIRYGVHSGRIGNWAGGGAGGVAGVGAGGNGAEFVCATGVSIGGGVESGARIQAQGDVVIDDREGEHRMEVPDLPEQPDRKEGQRQETHCSADRTNLSRVGDHRPGYRPLASRCCVASFYKTRR